MTKQAQSPERSFGLVGASNFREVGGYRGVGGRALRGRTIFRSDHLARLTAEDFEHVRALGVRRTFDFRGQREVAAASYAFPGIKRHALAIEPTFVQAVSELERQGQALTVEHAMQLLQQTYCDFARRDQTQFGDMFEALVADDQPAIIHCTAGKDRTGFAVALFLLALGVSREDVMTDYLLTNRFYRPPLPSHGKVSESVWRTVSRVEPDYLLAAFGVVEREFGGVDAYLAERLKVTAAARERLQALYLV